MDGLSVAAESKLVTRMLNHISDIFEATISLSSEIAYYPPFFETLT